MKISIVDGANGWLELRARPTESDGQPHISGLRYQWPFKPSSVDRLAVAAALSFAPWCAGRMELPSPISALTAGRIQRWFTSLGIWVSPDPVHTGALPIPGGEKSGVLHGHGPDAAKAMALPIECVGPTEGTGVKGNGVQVATNASYFDRGSNDCSTLLARVAVAVLVAEDIDVGVIVLGSERPLSATIESALRELLDSVGLGFRRDG